MRRFILGAALASVLSVSAMAGEIPSGGAPNPGEIPSGGSSIAGEIPSTGVTAAESSASDSAVMNAILAILGIVV